MAKDWTAHFTALFNAGGWPEMPPGTYLCEGIIKIERTFGLTIDMPGVVLRETEMTLTRRGQELLNFVQCVGTTIGRIELHGAKPEAQGYRPKYEGHHGIGLHACTNTAIFGPYIHDMPGDGIYIASQGGWLNSTPTRMTTIGWPTKIVEVGRHGIAATGFDGLTITGTEVRDFHRKWLDKYDFRVKSDVHRHLDAKPANNVIVPAPKNK